MIEIVIGLVFSGVIGLVLGLLRGRAPSSGFLWGFLLGPIGWVVVLVVGGKRCPECRGSVHRNARKCSNCGSNLISRTASGADLRAEAEASLRHILSQRD